MVTGYDDHTDLNIVILDKDENIIEWLDSDLCNIKETSAINKCRTIEITYPIDEYEIDVSLVHWYDQGNKIYIPATLGISSCLYVINTDYDIDFWQKNTVTVTAEEILTELNYNLVAFLTTVTPAPSEDGEGNDTTPEDDEPDIHSGEVVELTTALDNAYKGTQIFKFKDKIELTSEVLTAFFGYYYEIVGMDALDNEKKYISPSGTMTYMSLLRLIEEQTERVFITEYVNVDNHIKRRLSLRNYSTLRRTAQTEILDLNYNLDSLELNVSEENTYNAMAPEFTDNSTVINADTNQTVLDTSSTLVNNAQNASSNIDTTNANQTSTKPISEVIQDWLDYEVEPRQEHPMIIQKDTAGNLVSVATWYAPFRKIRGSLEIISERATESQYTTINSYNNDHVFCKCGKVSTSETIPQIIYNTLANALLNKLSPVYDLKIDVKDIQMLMGIPNLSYELYETLQVRIPNFDYFVPCRITGTTKNPHKPGENKITVETDVKSLRNLHETEIISSNMIVNDDKPVNIGGILQSEEMGLDDKIVTINIKLVQAFNEGTITDATNNTDIQQQSTHEFDPANNTYVFALSTLHEMHRYAFRLETEKGFEAKKPRFNARTVTGEVLEIPAEDCICIVRAHIQNWDVHRFYSSWGTNLEKYKKGGDIDQTISVHLYSREELTQLSNPMYLSTLGTDIKTRLAHIKKLTYSAFVWRQQDYNEIARRDGFVSSDGWLIGILTNSFEQLGGTCAPHAVANAFLKNYVVFNPKILGDVFDTDFTIGTYAEKIFNNWGSRDLVQDYSGYDFVELINVIFDHATFDEDIDGVNPNIYGNYNKYGKLTWVVPVDIAYLKTSAYYDGFYALNTFATEGNHVVCITSYKKVNGQRWVFVIDSNFPLFSPLYWSLYPSSYGWVKWEVIKNAMTFDFDMEGGKLVAYLISHGNGGLFQMNVGVNDDLEFKEDSITDPNQNIDIPITPVIITPLDLTNNTYLFHADDVQMAINEVYKYYIEQGMKHDIDTITTNITSVINQKHSLKMQELMGLAYSYMYYYQNNPTKKSSNIDLRYGKLEDSQKYIDKFGTDYDYFTPVYPQQKGYEANYIVCSALFHLGILSSPVDFFANKIEDVTFNDMMQVFNKKGLTSFVRETTSNILQSVLIKQHQSKFKSTVVIVYAYDNSIIGSSQYMNNRYPLMLYSLDDNNVAYCNLAGRGNSPGFNYNTTKNEYGTSNPWKVTTLNNILNWVDAAKENNPNGNNCLIISRYLTLGSV